MTLRKDGERVDPVAIRVLPICPCSFDGKSAFCRILARVQTGVACRRVRKRLGVAGPVTKESAYKVPYLKRQRSRLITGDILVRGQGEPPEYRIRNGREHGQRHDTEDPGPSETGWARGAHFRAQRDGEGCADQAQGRTGGQVYRRIETSLGMAGEKDRTGSTCWNFRQVGPVFAFGGEERRRGEG